MHACMLQAVKDMSFPPRHPVPLNSAKRRRLDGAEGNEGLASADSRQATAHACFAAATSSPSPPMCA